MQIPLSIKIQIVDKAGNLNPLGNILMGLKIYLNDGSWCNYHPCLKTDKLGQVLIDQKNIIKQSHLEDVVVMDKEPLTKSEIYIWSGEDAQRRIQTVKRLIDIYRDDNLTLLNIQKAGFSNDQIPGQIAAIKEQAKNDMSLYNLIQDSINSNIKIYTEPITDIWLNNDAKQYNFIVELIKSDDDLSNV